MPALRMAPTVREVQRRIGYNFNNAQYLWEALQAPGSVVRSGEVEGAGTERHSVGFQRFPDGNRRLAVLGDAVLKMALVEDWYRGDGVRERIFRVVTNVGSNVNLVRVGRTKGLDDLINKNPSEFKDKFVSPVTMAGTVEAIIGAVYLDSSMSSVPQVMQNLGLMPSIVRKIERKTGMAVPASESAKSTAGSTSTTEDHEEPETASTDSEEQLVMGMESSRELEKSLQEFSATLQLRQCGDENAQSAA